MGDVDAFIEWLREQGTPEPHLAAHRHYAGELAKHPSLSAALREHEEAGATPQRIANLRQTAARLVEFEEAKTAPPRPLPRQVAPRATPAPITAALYAPGSKPPRLGCDCKKEYDLYLDNDFGALASMLGGGIGIGTFLLVRMIGVLGALAIALGLAGLGGLATTLTICLRCEGCRRPIRGLDDDERAHLRKGRALTAGVTLALFVGAAICAGMWWSVVKSGRPY